MLKQKLLISQISIFKNYLLFHKFISIIIHLADFNGTMDAWNGLE